MWRITREMVNSITNQKKSQRPEQKTLIPVNFALEMCRAARRVKNEPTLRIIFGKQDGTLDCFHRGIE